MLGASAGSLMAHRNGALVTGRNIANAATPGYHRQRVSFDALGSGVTARTSHRSVERHLQSRLFAQLGAKAYSDTRARGMRQIESAVADIGEGSLQAGLDRLLGGFRELSAAPHDLALRRDVLDRGEVLAGRVRQAASELTTARREADRAIAIDVEQANRLIDEIAQLNRSMSGTEADAQASLRDRRDVAARQLTELTGARSFEDDSGNLTVLIADVTAVQGGEPRHLEAATDPTTRLRTVRFSGGSSIAIDKRVGGRMGGLLRVRDADIPAQMEALDRFAFELGNMVNARHEANVGLDGTGNRSFFTVTATATGAAAGLSVHTGVAGTPEAVGAAIDAGAVPGDGSGAAALAELDGQPVGSGPGTLSDLLAGIVVEVGNETARAEADFESDGVRAAQLEALHDSATGVSVEEQMIWLTRFQRGFEASSRVIEVVDGMLETLLRI